MPEHPYNSIEEPRNIPDNLKVPEGNVLCLRAHGKGVQIYTCPVTPDSKATPHAILLKGDRDEGDLAAIHFKGPSWQALDGSIVTGTVKERAPSPDPDGVDWLLLAAIPQGADGLFSDVTFIQRLYTDGGKPPAGGCDQNQNQAAILVEYSAEYFFYRSTTKNQ